MQNIADNFFNTYASRCYKGVEGMALFIFLCKVCHLLLPSSVCVFVLMENYAGYCISRCAGYFYCI